MTAHRIIVNTLLGGDEIQLRLTGPGYPELGVDDIDRALSTIPDMDAVELGPPTTAGDSLELVLTNIDTFRAMDDRFIKKLVAALLALVGNGASATVIDLLYRHAFEARILHTAGSILAVHGLRPLTRAELTELLDESGELSLEEALAGFLQALSRPEIIRICAEAFDATPQKTDELLSRKYGISNPARLLELLAEFKRFLA